MFILVTGIIITDGTTMELVGIIPIGAIHIMDGTIMVGDIIATMLIIGALHIIHMDITVIIIHITITMDIIITDIIIIVEEELPITLEDAEI